MSQQGASARHTGADGDKKLLSFIFEQLVTPVKEHQALRDSEVLGFVTEAARDHGTGH
jgi:hypothetical protein